MAVSEKEIKTLARLARLRFDDGEISGFVKEFDEIIDFANTVNCEVEGDTADIREVPARTIAWENLREDEVESSLPSEKILSNVQSDNGYFPVKRVVK
ncbi:MAG: Asp-tRNA(Asn)/Glu-tRNA(Gln) amidotransferase subunit GatC [Candidatus Coproplasma sp.]